MTSIRVFYLAACLGSALPLIQLWAQAPNGLPGSVPRLVRYEGVLSVPETKGNGPQGVEFAIYKEQSGGTALWSEIQNVEADAGGHYTILLGATKNGGVPPDVLGAGESRWLAITPLGGVEQPRVQLVSVPYALRAEEALRIAGVPAGEIVRKADLSDSVRETIRTMQPQAEAGQAKPNASGPTTFSGANTTQIVAVQQTSTGKGLVATATSGIGISAKGGSSGVAATATAATGTGVSGQGPAFGVTGTATKAAGVGVQGTSTDTTNATGADIGVQGIAQDVTGAGVQGSNLATTGASIGVLGLSSSSSGIGVQGNVNASSGVGVSGVNNAASGIAVGVSGSTASSGNGSAGVSGFAGSLTGSVYGVSGNTASSGNGSIGVYGNAQATTGQVFGVGGQTASTTGGSSGVIGFEAATTGSVYGVNGSILSSGNGSAGVFGNAEATTGQTSGVNGITASTTTNAAGVNGYASAATGAVFGVTGSTNSSTSGASGVNGYEGATSGGPVYGVSGYASSTNGIGVFGSATATSGFAVGVEGATASPAGIAGQFVNVSGSGLVISGQSGATYKTIFTVDAAGNGNFSGNLNVTGKITKGSGTFKIDHPLDPANKYLSHSFVESPDMKNFYDGIVTLDADGSAQVTLPDWFQALNRDFRYQLTCLGGYAPVYIASEIAANSFRIAGGRPGLRVSWAVTGIRQDPYAVAHPVVVEEQKEEKNVGRYLHPRELGQPAERGIR